MKIKKVLVVCDRLDHRGGLETHIISKVNELSKKYDVCLYVNAVAVDNKKEINKKVNIVCPWGEDCLEDIKGFNPDIVHGHPFTALDRAYKIAKTLKKKLFITTHGLYGIGNKQIIDYASKIFVCDHAIEDFIKKSIPNDKIHVLYNGINLDEFYEAKAYKPLASKLKIKKDSATIVVATRYADNKEVPVYQLIDIISELNNRMDNGLNVIFVGDGHALDKIKNIASNIKNVNIQFIGAVTNIRQYFNLADVVLCSARTAVEAVACNKIVFQMGIGKWGCLVDIDNYKDTLFNINKYTTYTNEELTNHIRWTLTQKDHILDVNKDLADKIRLECDIKNTINVLEQYYKGVLE